MEMSVLVLFVFSISVYSLAFGFIESPLAEIFRKMITKKLPEKYHIVVSCYHCVGFWSGLIVGLVVFPVSIYSFTLIPLYSAGITLIIQYIMANILLKNRYIDKIIKK